MKMFRVGTIENIIGDFAWVIQEKCWWGWRTIAKYYDEESWTEAVDRLEKKEGILVL